MEKPNKPSLTQQLESGYSFTTKNGLKCTASLLASSSQKEVIKRHLLSAYPQLDDAEKERMLERLERFSLGSCVFLFEKDGSEFGLIYHLAPPSKSGRPSRELLKELAIRIERIKKNNPAAQSLTYLFYGSDVVPRRSSNANLLITAIRKNASPGVLLLIDGKPKEEEK
jgi:hypothetical protein